MPTAVLISARPHPIHFLSVTAVFQIWYLHLGLTVEEGSVYTMPVQAVIKPISNEKARLLLGILNEQKVETNN